MMLDTSWSYEIENDDGSKHWRGKSRTTERAKKFNSLALYIL